MIILAPYFALRGRRHGESWSALKERLGILSLETLERSRPSATIYGAPGAGAIWIHAVSVGEVLAAQPIVEGLRRLYPERAILVSTTTETGRRLAGQRLQSADKIFYFPLDWIVPVRRALRSICPAIIIIMETEIWPNFLREARRQGIPIVIANARISERSFARFKRWRFMVGEFFGRVLHDADLFLAQSPEDSARLAEMGAPEDCIEVTGNLKYDAEPPAMGHFGEWLQGQVREQERWPLLVAGSVVADEEQSVLAAYDTVQRQWRRALLVLAPRKPNRFDAAADLVAAGGWTVVRRSHLNLGESLDENADVVLLDSIGELAGLYSLADAVFVGGSLVNAGGHNILEPAWFSKPPVFGPSMENFHEMAVQFLRSNAGVQVTSGPQLGKVWVQLIEDNSLRETMGKAARGISERNRGAASRCIERISSILDGKGSAA